MRRRGAVAGASAQVLAWFVPTEAASLNAMIASQGGASVHPPLTRGVGIGQAAADAVIAHVMADGFMAVDRIGPGSTAVVG